MTKSRLSLVALAVIVAALGLSGAHVRGQQAAAPSGGAAGQPHMNMTNMMSRMRTNDAKLDELVKKMNAATGTAKTDAMAELLTALVEDRRNASEPWMANMMSRMNMMSAMRGRGQQAEPTPGK